MVNWLIVTAHSALSDYYQPLLLGELSFAGDGILVSAFTSKHNLRFLLLSCILFASGILRVISLAFSEKARRSREQPVLQFASPEELPAPSWDIFGVQKVQEAARHKLSDTYLSFTQQRFCHIGLSTYTSRLFGKSVIDTIEPSNIQAILSTNFQDWSLGASRNELWAPLLGQGIFAADGHAWRSSRTRLRPTTNLDADTHFPIFEKHIQSLIKICTSRDQKAIDLSSLFFRFTLDTASELFFGRSCGSLQEASNALSRDSYDTAFSTRTISANAFTKAFNRAQRRLADKLVLGKLSRIFLSPRTHRQFAKDCSTVHSFIDECIHEAVGELKQCGDTVESRATSSRNDCILLHSLLRAGIDPEDIKYDLVNMLVAGRDTTASLLSNLFFELARNPRIYATIRQEVIEHLGPSQDSTSIPPTDPQLRRMKYLRACIDEALRLYPPVPLNSRTAIRDTVLPCGGGVDGQHPILVRRGTRVAYNMYAMHRRRDIWGDDADVFRPERWFHRPNRTDWAFLPFSGGPRVCLGRYLAIAEMQYVVCRLAQHYPEIHAAAYNSDGDIERRCALLHGEISESTRRNLPGEDESAVPWKWREDLSLTLSSGGGTWVQFVTEDENS